MVVVVTLCCLIRVCASLQGAPVLSAVAAALRCWGDLVIADAACCPPSRKNALQVRRLCKRCTPFCVTRTYAAVALTTTQRLANRTVMDMAPLTGKLS